MSGGGSGGGGQPANTTSNDTNTIIQQAPAYSQQYISDLLGQAATSAAQPYQQFPGQQVAGFTDPQTQAFSQIQNLTGSGTGGAAATQGAAANNSASGAANTANTISGIASPYLQASSMYNPAAAASAYMNAAAETTTPQGISSYMSPYLQNDISGLETQAQQNWNQFTAPGVNNSFISAGQAGSGRNEQVLGQQANLANQALTGQIGQAENAAYTTAGQQAGTAASNLSGLGNLAGTTAASEATNLQNIGTGLGNIAATQAGAQGAAASNLANTANTVQNTGITGASALQAVGQQQQNQAQTNINTAESNFNAQNLWPETQESFMNSIINGLPSPGSSTTSAGQVPTTTNMIGSTSPLGSLAGSLVGAGALASAGGGARGGMVKNFAGGGLSIGSGGISGDLPPDDLDPNTLSVLLGLQGAQDAQGAATMGDQSSPINIPNDQPAPSSTLQTSVPPDSAGIQMPFNPPPDLDRATAKADNDVSVNAVSSPLQPDTSVSSSNSSREAPLTSAVTDNNQIRSTGDNVSGGNDVSGAERSPLSTLSALPQLDANKMRQYQLLSMAKGFLTPAHSGAEALGNAFGNYAQSGSDFMKWQAEQQQMALQFDSLNAYRQGRLGVSEDAIAQRAGRPVGQISQLTQMLVAQGMKPEDAMIKAAAISKGQISAGVAPSAVTTPNGQIVAPKSSPQAQPTVVGGSANVDTQTGDVTPPTFGFDTSNIPPKVFNQMATEDSKRRQADINNMPIAANVLRSLDQLEPNLGKVTTGSTFTPAIVAGAKTFNSQGDTATAAANIEKNTNDLATELSKFQYMPGMRGSVLGLQTILASKPGLQQPEQTNKNIVSGLRAKVTDYQLTGELAQQYRQASPLKITDQNTYQLDNALKTIYPIEQVDPKTGNTTFNKANVAKIREAIPDAIVNPRKYLSMAQQAQQGGGQPQNATPSTADAARAELARRAAARQQQGAQ